MAKNKKSVGFRTKKEEEDLFVLMIHQKIQKVISFHNVTNGLNKIQT
jgi:hypothetical protein